MRRKRIKVGSVSLDTTREILVINGYEIDLALLSSIINPDRRLLWGFTMSEDGKRIQATAYSEKDVIWMSPERREE